MTNWNQRSLAIFMVVFVSVNTICFAQRQTVDNIPWPIIRLGLDNQLVVVLNDLLKVHGYVTGGSSLFDENLRTSIVRFQSAQNLEPDGVVGRNTWVKLLPTENLANRSFNNPYVTVLQNLLNTNYQATLVADGDFGSNTQTAVKAFQKEHGLYNSSQNPDGIVQLTTWHALLSAASPENVNRLTHQAALERLQNAGIVLNRTCHNRYVEQGCTSLELIRAENIDGVIALKAASRCTALVVNGGTEIGHTSRGNENHFNGFKVDIRSTGTDGNCISNYITNTYTRTGIRAGDGAVLYQDTRQLQEGNSRDSGLYALEVNPPHWDVRY